VTLEFTADRGDAQIRLDRVLVRRATTISRMSRTLAQCWIDGGRVTVDAVPVARSSVKVREGAAIVVNLPETAVLRETPRPEAVSLDVLYEDDDVLAINKPAGMVVHPSFRNTSGTVLNAVLWRYRDRPALRPGLVSRLDKDTSGVLLLALSPGIHARIQRDAAVGRVAKQYLAVVRGTPRPSQGTITLPLAHDPADRRRIVVSTEGMPSETRYRVVSFLDGYAVVACELVTGRTHQIRVHMATRGWPVAGDVVYGQADPGIARQALHAWRVSLLHPTSRTPLSIEAPPPKDMLALSGLRGFIES
jgi:23S rRNA pseudouridine1911/1915/1917 synthase